MRRSVFGLAMATTAAAALCACHPVERRHHGDRADTGRVYTVGDRLDCPDSVDELNRSAQAADGRSCQYRGPDDEVVDLTLTALNGRDPLAVLTDMQQGLKADIGAVAAKSPEPPKSEADADADDEEDAHDHDRNNRDMSDHGGDHDRGDHDHAKIDLPGLHIDANGDKASIRLPGLSLNADSDGAHVQSGWGPYKNMQVEAHDGQAEIHAGDVTDAGAKLFYVLASDAPGPKGYHSVGYVARGPRAGPLVVAVFRSKSEEHNHAHIISGGVERLVRINVKG